jgi:hypothetical protein
MRLGIDAQRLAGQRLGIGRYISIGANVTALMRPRADAWPLRDLWDRIQIIIGYRSSRVTWLISRPRAPERGSATSLSCTISPPWA